MKYPSTQFCWVSNFDQSSFELYVKQSGERNLGQAARKQRERAHLGDRGTQGEPFPIKEMTPERKKKTPLYGLDPGHTA